MFNKEFIRDSAIKEEFSALLAEMHLKAEFSEDYTKYQQDPVGFAKDVLGIKIITDDVAEVFESVRDNRITLARSATGTGKSFGAASLAIWWYKCFIRSEVFTVANPFENQRILWGEITELVETHPELFKDDRIITNHIERSAKQFIHALPMPTTGTDASKEAKFSGKHYDYLLFIVDEGDCVPDFAYQGIEGCMSGGIVIRILILFNPRQTAGIPYRHECVTKTANVVHLTAFNHPNVITGQHIIPGAVAREETVRRINLWCRPLVTGEKRDSECFELPKFLEGVIAKDSSGQREYPPLGPGFYKIMDPAFSYMVLGEYPSQAVNQLISREWINQARARWDLYVAKHGEVPPWGTAAVCGQDVAEFGTDFNVLRYRYGGYLEKMSPQCRWNGVDTTVSAERAFEQDAQRNVSSHYVDGDGIGSSIAPTLNKAGRGAVSVKFSNKPTKKACEQGEFANIKAQLAWAVREWLRGDTAMLPPDEMLIEELLVILYWTDKTTGKLRITDKDEIREKLKRSCDDFDALCLTFFTGGFFDGCDFG